MSNALTPFLKAAAGAIVAPLIALLHFAGYYNIQKPPAPVPIEQPLGASNVIPTSVALFSTSLQSAITSSQTTMTLVSATYNNGASTLASSSYDFVIDEGTASAEFVSADCTGTTCTNMQRGLDFITGTTSVTSLQFSHRRGASVKIATGPIILKLNNLAAGREGYPTPITYASNVATTSFKNAPQIVDKDYVDSVAFSGAGVINATPAARGVVQIASGQQIASSTGICSTSAPCVISADNATSTYNAATAPLKVVVTGNQGTIDPNFVANGAPTGSIMAYSTTTPPAGWLLADGSSYATSTYPNLFAKIGYSYGGSSANFNVPNLSGRAILMASSTSNIGQTGGESNHTLTQAQLPNVNFNVTVGSNGGGSTSYISVGSSYTTATTRADVSSGGSGTPFNVLPPYLVLQYIIKY